MKPPFSLTRSRGLSPKIIFYIVGIYKMVAVLACCAERRGVVTKIVGLVPENP